MEKIGIICEYNPFHNGHIYHINKIKEKYPDSLIILVLNGYFLERGEISILSKYDKCEIALQNNVDLVMELPVLYGCQSADTFAYRSIQILNELGVNKVIFGSESNDIDTIMNLARESTCKKHDAEVKKYLDEGLNYPTSLAKALNTNFNFLSNDLLGISYCKAILEINDKITAETIQRTNNYLDTESCEEIVSASNVREKIKMNEDISKYVPKCTIEKLKFIDKDLYFKILKAIILRSDDLDTILDVDEGIENRLKSCVIKASNIDEFIEAVKTKRYTYNKINRMFIHILLGIKKCDAKINMDTLKVLGMNINGKDYLNSIKKDINIMFNNKDSMLYKYEIKASLLYDTLTNQNTFEKEKTNKPIIY